MTTGKPKILLAEDEEALGNIVAESLEMRGFSVHHCKNGSEALSQLLNEQYDLALVDVMMPGIDGFTLVQKFRMQNTEMPVIFLTSKLLPNDVVTGFESGGNDYLKKPFSMEELVIRIKVLLSGNRLLKTKDQAVEVKIGAYLFNAARQELMYQTTLKKLTSRENEVLSLLFQHKHSVLSKQVLLNTIWGNDSFFNARTADVFISRLRKYLQEDPRVQIINVRGIGYKLVW